MTAVYPPKRILVPVDFGEASARAVEVAGALALKFGAVLEALHVESLDAPPYFTMGQVKALEAQRTQARAAAERYLSKFLQKHGAAGARALVADGAPAEVILQRAGSADAIVMGTNDKSIAARIWMGSVAERVHRHATVPVLIVHAAESRPVEEYAARLRDEAASRGNKVEEK